MIAHVAGPGVALVDSAETTAGAVARLLAEKNLQRQSAPPAPRFLATDAPERFARVGEIFMGRHIEKSAVELVDL
jgi:glutamate racemase